MDEKLKKIIERQKSLIPSEEQTESEEQEIDESLGLKQITIRLSVKTVEKLKEIAKGHGMGYQPYVRSLLDKHVLEPTNMSEIVEELRRRMKKMVDKDDLETLFDKEFQRRTDEFEKQMLEVVRERLEEVERKVANG